VRHDVEFFEFVPGAGDDAVVRVMEELADGSGWLTLDPAFDDRFPPPQQTTLGRLLSGRGPAVPRATWVPAELDRRTPEPVSVGILHGTGPKSAERLDDKDVAVPERWVPIDVPHLEVLQWVCAATPALTRVPLLEQWRVAVHRP
jgi:hypothetical protein